jgi:hypothetical protein
MPPAAVVISSVLFVLAHVTHGSCGLSFLSTFWWAFGVTAYLTNTILPVIPVHITGDLTFFILVWPHDAARRLVWKGGGDKWFWIHVAQAVVFTALAIAAYRRLAVISEPLRTQREVSKAASS